MPGTTSEQANGFLEQSKHIVTVDAAAKLQSEIAAFVAANKASDAAPCRTALVAYVQAGLFVADDTPADNKTRKERLVKIRELETTCPVTFSRLMKVCSFETNFTASFDLNDVEKIIDQSVVDGVNAYVKSEFPTRLAATMMQTDLEACVSESAKLAEKLKEPLQKFLDMTDDDEIKKIVDVSDTGFAAKFNQAATARLITLKKPAPVADPVIEILFKFEHIFKDFKKTLEDSKVFSGATFDPANPNKATITDKSPMGGAQATTTIEKSDVHGMVSVTGKKEPAVKAFVAAHLADLFAAKKIIRDPMGKITAIDGYKFKLNRDMIDIHNKEAPDMTSADKEAVLKALDKEFSDQFGAIYVSGSILKAGPVAPAPAATDNNISAKLSRAPFLGSNHNSNRRPPADDQENQSVNSPIPGKSP